MKRNYKSGLQKRQSKNKKIVEAAKNFQRLSSWLTRPITSKADEHCRTKKTSIKNLDVLLKTCLIILIEKAF